MRKFLLLVTGTLLYFCLSAQLIKVSPAFPDDDDVVTIVFDASLGNRGLFDYNGDVYVHTGVITSQSTVAGDWKYVPTSWNSNNAAHRLTSLGGNRYSFTINGIRNFYQVPAGEAIRKMAFVFRSYNPSGNVLEGKASDLSVDQGNIYWNVYPSGTHAVKIISPISEPRYQPHFFPPAVSPGDYIGFRAEASKSGLMQVKLNGTVIREEADSTGISVDATITMPGENVLIASSEANGLTIGDTLKFFVAAPVTVQPLPPGVREGINYEGSDAATLVLFAPGKTRVNVLGDFNNWTETTAYQMNRSPDGKYFWLKLTALDPGKEYAYQYLIDGSMKIGDPYCEKILDPVNDPFISSSTYPDLIAYPTGKTTGIVSVLQTDQAPYSWQVNQFQRPDKRSLIIYEVLVRDFIEKHDWKTLKDSIGYFKSLGVNALHLMPFNEFEGNLSWGYNPSYYFAPDKYYGTKNTLKAFIDECHKNGIAVIMDMVLNHSFGQSPMVQLYFDGSQNRPAPGNPWFNPVARHAFNVGYDMNHESIDTKRFFKNVCSFWLSEYRLDGFRFDLSKGFTQKKTCDDNGGNCDVNAWSAYDASRVAIWKSYYDTLQKKEPGCYVILEHLGVNNEEAELADYGMLLWGNMNYQFTEATKGQVTNSNFSGGLYNARNWQRPHLISYMESHDEERSMYRCETEGLSGSGYNIRDENTALRRNGMAATFLLAIPGPKLIWQFGELGYDYSINQCSNGTVNNNCRTDLKPIRWDYYSMANRITLRNVYKAMINLRTNPYYHNLFIGGTTSYDLSGGIKWLSVTTDTSALMAVGNFGLNSSNGTVTFPKPGVWFDLFSGELLSATGGAQSITLPAGSYRLFLNRNLNGTIPTAVNEVVNDNNLQVNVYPNPVGSASIIHYTVSETSAVGFRLMDLNGRVLQETRVGTKAPGQYRQKLNSVLPLSVQSGLYLLHMQSNGKRKVIKLMLP
ncbi:alpha-amylase family glycosyl hydrolase [Flavihumibacter solisilvae]|uniref:Glycosyl hydrolase family 13 catalytic domain-containing protein n=1 Tax=Flavihumibacter solisilvae TaxID=1349421 RepID=A0A0C1L519_9BACT|nr:alpha-amylase family glycosyl hydrolase [Flavihumibacter solisilvae]KIC95212.1 hypothetical protein OI18_07900 [Flavihumibacter solisilvae]